MTDTEAEDQEAPSFASLRSRFEALASSRTPSSTAQSASARSDYAFAKVSDSATRSSGDRVVCANDLGENRAERSEKRTSPLPSPELLKGVPGVLEGLQYAETGETELAPQPPTLPPKPSSAPAVSTQHNFPPPVPTRPTADVLAATLVGSPFSETNEDSSVERSLPVDMVFNIPKSGQSTSMRPPPSPSPGAVKTSTAAAAIHVKSAAALHRFQLLRTTSKALASTSSSGTDTPSSSNEALRSSLANNMPPPKRSSTMALAGADHLGVPPARSYASAGNSGSTSPAQAYGSQGEHSDEADRDSSDSDAIDKEVVQAMGPATTISARASEELPDATRANRKPPHYVPMRSMSSKSYHTSCVAVHGAVVVFGHHDKLRVARAKDDWESVCHHISVAQEKRDIKICALAFRAPCKTGTTTSSANEDGRYLWCGTKEGDLLEFDVNECRVTQHRQGVHTAPVILLQTVGQNMISVDESGKICTWIARPITKDDGEKGALRYTPASLKDAPVTQRVVFDRHSCPMIIGDELWVASVGESSNVARVCKVRIYRPFSIDKPFNAVSRPVLIPESMVAGTLGAITSGAVVPLHTGHVYLGHQSGHISVWSRSTYSCVAVFVTGMSGITSLCGVRGWFIWAGSRQGNIRIFDVRERPWQVVKIFEAHKGSTVTQLIADPSVIDSNELQVLSSSVEGDVCLWDGLLTSDWMTQELERRFADYSTFRQLTALQITFNIDAASTADFDGTELAGLNVLDTMSTMPDIIVVGFQELVDLQDTRIMAKSILLGGARKSKGHDVGERLSHQARAWTQKITQDIRKKVIQWQTATASQNKGAIATAGDEMMYDLVLQDSLVGLFTAVFVKEKESINVRQAAIASIKTGFGGRMGNKGAIIASLLIDDTPIAWVNCHLAAGQTHTRERNADLVNIFESEPFSDRAVRDALAANVSGDRADGRKKAVPIVVDAYAGGGDGAMIMPDHEIVFLSGDLNYRIDLGRSKCLEMVNKKEWQTLLARDQLLRQLRDNSSHRLRPFHEAPITFAPTYKFDRKSSTYDTSEKQRVPAYCDRILWYARSEDAEAVQCLHYKSETKTVPSDHRPVVGVLSFQIRNSDPQRRTAVLEELQMAWRVAQAERLRAAREYYVQSKFA